MGVGSCTAWSTASDRTAFNTRMLVGLIWGVWGQLGLYRVSWGHLRPHGIAKATMGTYGVVKVNRDHMRSHVM